MPRHISGSTMMFVGPALAAGLLAACRGGPPPPEAAATAAPEQRVENRVEAALRANGLTVGETATGLRATTTSDRFIRCDAVLVSGDDNDSARRFTPPQSLTAIADIDFAAADGGTRASWRISYAGNYLDRVRNEPFALPCDGTGTLEELLRQAVDG